MDFQRELNDIIGTFSNLRERKILIDRLLDIGKKTTLPKIGKEFGLTGESIRLLEARIRRKLAYRRRSISLDLSTALLLFRQKAGDCINLPQGMELLPQNGFLRSTYSDLDDAARLFLYYAGPYCIWGQYMVAVKASEKLTYLNQILWKRLKRGTLTMDEANKLGQAAGIRSPRLIEQILVNLQAEHFHVYPLSGDRWAYVPSIKDRAVLFLEETGQPVGAEALAAKCRIACSSLIAHISGEPRIIRFDKRIYGLREWGYTPPIHDLNTAIEQSDSPGQVKIEKDKLKKLGQ